ncbi:hypothetical protein Slin15195_G057880 [Septoria linicola]|uniref:Uncharacterized protein n=1 Tax=Septoria linicola TaxID=215465 RepID=A0A9Q9EJQ7_9PEZI|nr:hypothetical protein Slin14017_G073730 [Septoria linicola]USW52469.1 hypothetical protein Slin15195_G057880 [Septoria linicola]
MAAPVADNYIPGHYRPTRTTHEKVAPSVIPSVIPSTIPKPAPKPAQVSNIPSAPQVSNIPTKPQVSNISDHTSGKVKVEAVSKQWKGKKQEAAKKPEEWWERHEWS